CRFQRSEEDKDRFASAEWRRGQRRRCAGNAPDGGGRCAGARSAQFDTRLYPRSQRQRHRLAAPGKEIAPSVQSEMAVTAFVRRTDAQMQGDPAPDVRAPHREGERDCEKQAEGIEQQEHGALLLNRFKFAFVTFVPERASRRTLGFPSSSPKR